MSENYGAIFIVIFVAAVLIVNFWKQILVTVLLLLISTLGVGIYSVAHALHG